MSGSEKSKAQIWIPIIISFLTLVAGGGWGKIYLESQNQKEIKSEQLKTKLINIETLLATNKAIKDRIYTQYREGSWGILESYVEKVKKGEDKSGIILLAKDISTMEQNNRKVIELLKDYSVYILTPEFEAAKTDFINHAQNWVNLASLLSQIVESGEQYPYAEPFPVHFTEALQKEIQARNST